MPVLRRRLAQGGRPFVLVAMFAPLLLSSRPEAGRRFPPERRDLRFVTNWQSTRAVIESSRKFRGARMEELSSLAKRGIRGSPRVTTPQLPPSNLAHYHLWTQPG